MPSALPARYARSTALEKSPCATTTRNGWIGSATSPGVGSAGLPGNALPYALDVKAADPERLPALAAKIRTMDGVHKVRGWEDFDRVITIVRAVRAVSIVGVIILLVTTAFIISNAIRLTLYARRREIRIMQLVGATNETIRNSVGARGNGLWRGWSACGPGAAAIGRDIYRLLGSECDADVRTVLERVDDGTLALGMMVAGMVIGAIGSLVSIRMFLRD